MFTDDSVLAHPLGGGQEAFEWHKRQKKASPVQVERHGDEAAETGNGWAASVDSETVSAVCSLPDVESTEEGARGKVETDETAGVTMLSSKLSSLVSSGLTCSSYFIEPVEWMESMIIGCLQGKVGVQLVC